MADTATRPTCPRCESTDLIAWLTCHTWSQRRDDGSEGWMSCMGCGSAMHYCCGSDDCDWSYDHGLNPHNPRSARNEADRPDWLAAPFDHRQLVVDGFVYDAGDWRTVEPETATDQRDPADD